MYPNSNPNGPVMLQVKLVHYRTLPKGSFVDLEKELKKELKTRAKRNEIPATVKSAAL